MDFSFDLFLPKNVDCNNAGLKEVYVEWGGVKYPQVPAVFTWDDNIFFEKYSDAVSWCKLPGLHLQLTDYNVYSLKGNSLSELEWQVNNGLDIETNTLYAFAKAILSGLEHWVILTMIDWDDFSEIHNVENGDQAIAHLLESLKWESPKGIAVIKNKNPGFFEGSI